MKHQKNVHVVPNGSQWSAKTAENSRSAKNFETQAAAITKARQIAVNSKSELLIHRKDGRIREKILTETTLKALKDEYGKRKTDLFGRAV